MIIDSLISVAQTQSPPTVVHFDPGDRLFKLPLSPPAEAVPPPTPIPPHHPYYINSIHRYATAQTKAIAEEVDLWHRILGNCHAATMSSLAEPVKVTNFPSHLTPSIIRKHFPFSYPDCPMGNLQGRSSHYSDTSSTSISSEFEVDFKGKWTDSDGRPAPTFKKELYSFTAVDTSSRYIFTKLCPNRVGVIDHLESLRLFVASSGKTLTIIRTDN